MRFFNDSKFKAGIAVLLVLAITVLAGCGAGANNAKTNANFVSAYDAENSDFQLHVDAADEIHDISDLLFGIFFEDINFAADGGLYAEKVANRSFEFTELAAGDQLYHWNVVNEAAAEVKVNDTANALNENNTNYLVLANGKNELAGIENTGFLEGMCIEKDAEYNFSVYAKAIDGYSGPVTVRLTVAKLDKNGNKTGESVAAEAKIDGITDQWEKYSLSLTSNVTAAFVEKGQRVTLQVLIENGSAAFDMVSLFPKDTYKGRENGMRNDLATLLEELQPKFLRFPGGCVIEGRDDDGDYSWKDSVGAGRDGQPLLFNGTYGDVAARKQGISIWTDINATDDPWPSFMSYGLGFFEYFQLAEDIGAVGVPVINAGLYCQSGADRGGPDLDSERFKEYVQDMLDLVEFCRGDASTTWGKVRAALGHEEPFALKYICIGNENWRDNYYVRYKAFLDAFNKAKAADPERYDGLELIYSAGPDDGISGIDYLASYEYAQAQLGNSTNAADFAGAIDHHYYNDPEWFYQNTDYYDEDNYKRNVNEMTDTLYGGAINVFLGEYASWSNTLNSALAEAAYMTGLERNGDIVRMATYAPLFSSVTARHWNPDLIWYNNQSSIGSINYYMQKLFSTNAGTKLLFSSIEGTQSNKVDLSGKVGLGTWFTTAEFDNVKIVDNVYGEVFAEDDFSAGGLDKAWEKVSDGDWTVADGKLSQNNVAPAYSELGSAIFFGDASWNNYTFTVDATKTGGDEAFFIPFLVNDSNNAYFWNIGGWGNTVSCLQKMENGAKSGQVEGTVKPFAAETGKTYQLKIVVDGTNIKCYIDDELYIDYETYSDRKYDAYQVVSTDESGDIIIKLVNVTDSEKTVAVDIAGAENIGGTAKVYQVAGNDMTDDNIFGQPEKCIMEEFEVSGFADQFNYTVPKYSATVIRITRG